MKQFKEDNLNKEADVFDTNKASNKVRKDNDDELISPRYNNEESLNEDTIKEDIIPENEEYEADANEQPVSDEPSSEETQYKRIEEKEKKNDYITPAMKTFRMVVGMLAIAAIVYTGFFGRAGAANYKSNLISGKLDGINAGEMLSKNTVKLDAKDFTVDTGKSYGKIELSIWNFVDKEDGDYVQVFVDGSPNGEAFSIRHKPVKVSVPDKAVIQVRGIRDGSNNGITYGVTFSKTGETYLNTVPLNAANTYTIKSAE
ncbi:hypothetical protein JHL18_22205 [Clostridium sp. YIM B02505]|uniref:Uncharacterized protein n=1 Tax=Clostridium yunnanense TaxID=2800325 RepID=A0ABS1EVC7_9CLOT|nr:hypothetical protein [Clostridium yunnanense]MBK1813339.1 hypothetical protein [Clostridium yunnanense]